MRHRIIHLINPKTDSLTTRPLYLNRALYSPLAGLLAVAGAIPRDRYEVVLTDENIESIDYDLETDLVGISAMTCYVNRGYEIADAFRARGVPVVMVPMVLAATDFGRPIVAPPGIPADRLKIFREAFLKTMRTVNQIDAKRTTGQRLF